MKKVITLAVVATLLSIGFIAMESDAEEMYTVKFMYARDYEKLICTVQVEEGTTFDKVLELAQPLLDEAGFDFGVNEHFITGWTRGYQGGWEFVPNDYQITMDMSVIPLIKNGGPTPREPTPSIKIPCIIIGIILVLLLIAFYIIWRARRNEPL